MRIKWSIMLLLLILSSGCRSISQGRSPCDYDEMGPTEMQFWELRRDMERGTAWPVGEGPWDNWWR